METFFSLNSVNLSLINMISIISATLFCLTFTIIAIISKWEGEEIAFHRSLIAAIATPLPFLILGLFDFPYQETSAWIIHGILAGGTLLLILPIKSFKPESDAIPNPGYDERDTMFSRRELEKGTDRYDTYYKSNPEYQVSDDNCKNLPGLLSMKAQTAHRFMYASAKASFIGCGNLWDVAKEGPISDEKVNADPEEMTKYIQGWGKTLGAHSIGTTKLKDYHKYSVRGRRHYYGQENILTHTYAIALTVEMDYEMTRGAPNAQTVVETAHRYLDAGTIAVQIAQFIRNLGYEATAHVDAQFQVICPLVARDAGLGEIGRMGLLMTPTLGPRCRIAVVTTDLPIATLKRAFDNTMIEFCNSCKKCANVCPSAAIPHDNREIVDGVLRWKINHERCYKYWCICGTDCGRCIATCPYSHPNTFIHNIVRYFIGHNVIFRKLAALMDDLLYGKKPRSFSVKEWGLISEK